MPTITAPTEFYKSKWLGEEIDTFFGETSDAQSAAQSAKTSLVEIRKIQSQIPTGYLTLAEKVDANTQAIADVRQEMREKLIWVNVDGVLMLKCEE